jgi:hypothetical protein
MRESGMSAMLNPQLAFVSQLWMCRSVRHVRATLTARLVQLGRKTQAGFSALQVTDIPKRS